MGRQAGPARKHAAAFIHDHVVPGPADMAEPFAPADDAEPAVVKQALRSGVCVQDLGLQGPEAGRFRCFDQLRDKRGGDAPAA